MAGQKKTTRHGLAIELWETSFRVHGMSKVLSVGRDFDEEQLIQMVDAIYETAYDEAVKCSIDHLADSAASEVRNKLKKYWE